MKRLIYTFERARPAHGSECFRLLLDDVILGITMAGLGLGDVQRRVDGATDHVQATLSFHDDKTLLRFNLRIERALAIRGVKIKKIQIAEAFSRRDEHRAVA